MEILSKLFSNKQMSNNPMSIEEMRSKAAKLLQKGDYKDAPDLCGNSNEHKLLVTEE